MALLNVVDGIISYVRSSENPLSSDAFIIKGEKYYWIFDVGANEESFSEIEKLELPLNIVISHFHPDHISNISKLTFDRLYVSKNTYRYLDRYLDSFKLKEDSEFKSKINIVAEDFYIEDGIKIRIFQLPSSHAKGCLALEVNDAYVFLGDAIYPATKGDIKEYNQQILYEEIKKLKTCKGDSFFISHDKTPMTQRTVILRYLDSVLD